MVSFDKNLRIRLIIWYIISFFVESFFFFGGEKNRNFEHGTTVVDVSKNDYLFMMK